MHGGIMYRAVGRRGVRGDRRSLDTLGAFGEVFAPCVGRLERESEREDGRLVGVRSNDQRRPREATGVE